MSIEYQENAEVNIHSILTCRGTWSISTRTDVVEASFPQGIFFISAPLFCNDRLSDVIVLMSLLTCAHSHTSEGLLWFYPFSWFLVSDCRDRLRSLHFR